MNEIQIHIELCRSHAKLPAYANPGDAGMDIYAAEEVTLSPGETAVIPTGLKLAIPEGYEIQVRPRSGISLKTPLRVTNSPGTIDSGYRDELGIILTNTSCTCSACAEELLTIDSRGNRKGTYHIRRGDRIAQIVLQAVPRMQFTVVDSVRDIGENRGGGFGSSGVR